MIKKHTIFHVSDDIYMPNKLSNDPLYFSFDSSSWLPSHLDGPFFINSFSFHVDNKEVYYTKSFNEFQSLLVYADDDDRSEDIKANNYSDKLKELIDCGKKVFILLENNDKNEPEEGFIINPKDNLTYLYTSIFFKDKKGEVIRSEPIVIRDASASLERSSQAEKELEFNHGNDLFINSIKKFINNLNDEHIDSALFNKVEFEPIDDYDKRNITYKINASMSIVVVTKISENILLVAVGGYYAILEDDTLSIFTK